MSLAGTAASPAALRNGSRLALQSLLLWGLFEIESLAGQTLFDAILQDGSCLALRYLFVYLFISDSVHYKWCVFL